MKAHDLKQVIRFFDPTKPLSNVEELRVWYVERADTPRGRLRILLETQEEPQKVLFVGHRGSGKTTELNKLALELEAGFHTIGFNALEITGRTSPEYEDLMLAISTRVTRYCIEEKLIRRPIAEPAERLWKDLYGWWQRLVAGQEFKPAKPEENVGVKLQTILGQLELGVRQSSRTREDIKNLLNQQMPELIQRLNWVIEQAEADRARKLLIVVEGLDKVDLEAAGNIFRDHAQTITAPKAHMIFTFPLALRHSDDFNTVRLSFPEVRFLHNFRTHHADGEADDAGLGALHRIVEARADLGLFEDGALDLLLRSNGGIPVWLVVLVRSAALYALERGSGRISVEDAENAVKELRHDTLAPLSPKDRETLRSRHRDRRLARDSSHQRLIYLGSLIEYQNGAPWCDAHPVLWPVLNPAYQPNT